MAKYLFKIANSKDGYQYEEIVEIEDRILLAKTEDEVEQIIFSYYLNWRDNFLVGDWKRLLSNNVISLNRE